MQQALSNKKGDSVGGSKLGIHYYICTRKIGLHRVKRIRNGPTVSSQNAMTYIPDNVPKPKKRKTEQRNLKRNKEKIFWIGPPRRGSNEMAVVTLRIAFKLLARVPCHLPFGVELFIAKSPGNILMIGNVNERPETYH